jgi:hypothetical protein
MLRLEIMKQQYKTIMYWVLLNVLGTVLSAYMYLINTAIRKGRFFLLRIESRALYC